MNRSKAITVCVVLLLGAATFLVLRHRHLAELRAQNSHLREVTPEVEWLRGENEALQRRTASSEASKLSAAELSELMRLRSAAGLLRDQLAEALRKSASTNDQLIGDLSVSEDVGNTNAWSDLGAATPTAALQTLFWAWNTANLDRATGLFQLDLVGPASTNTEAIMRASMEGHLRFEMAHQASNTLSTEVISQQPINDHEIILNFWKTTRDGKRFQISQKMRRVENQWYFVGTMEAISESPTSFRLLPQWHRGSVVW